MVTDDEYMARALALAARGLGRTTPNPMVGAVIVAPDGVVVGAGYHERAGEPHAEIHALRAAGVRALGATLYTTLEPCCHVGRTGPCAEAIVIAGVARVVAAVEDPNPVVAGGGVAYLREHGITVAVGVCREAATRLNLGFFTVVRRRRPAVILKVACGLDGRIAALPGTRTEITGPEARKRTHLLRAEVDAVAVGSGTVLADDPLLTARDVFREQPLTRVVFDRRLRTPPGARVLSTIEAGPVIIMTTAEAMEAASARTESLRAAGATVVPVPGEGGLHGALEDLAGRGVHTLLLEGGAALHTAAWRERLVDRVMVFVSPRPCGQHGVGWLDLDRPAIVVAALEEGTVASCGDDLLIDGYVHGPH